jgi:malate synthase
MAWDRAFVNLNIDALTMTYGYMRHYEDRVRRAANTPDQQGQYVLWQGGMEPNIPVGSDAGVRQSMKKAVAGAEREWQAGASGKWVAHWKMVHIARPVWAQRAVPNQMRRAFPRLSDSQADADVLFQLEPAPRTVLVARDLIRVGCSTGTRSRRDFRRRR